ncbi:hypothetical protein MMC12_001149 [Toensbergia leucococca]|nr:hypothetical protein [Toensbergia leucococca]
MDLITGDYSDMIQMDNTYLDRIAQRKELVTTRLHDVIGAGDSRVKPAINELYSWMLGVYLPQRFPTMFKLQPHPSTTNSKSERHQTLKSLVTGDEYPVIPPEDQEVALKTVACIIDEECLLLLPATDGDGYILGASIWVFQNGVRIAGRVGCRIRDIHRPVPEYKKRLEKSMDRYFAKIPVGKFMRRESWSICTRPELYNPSNSQIAFDPDKVRKRPSPPHHTSRSVNPQLQCNLHIDHQTLHRLPDSKALLLAFHQYKTPLSELRDEDDGKTAEALLMGIEGLAKSTTPGMAKYKLVEYWEEDVKRYLRREE